jgi:hypothetical protein
MYTPFTIVSVRGSIVVVHYPFGIEGTDDSVGYLWFDVDDFSTPNNPIMYPGDRTAHATEEDAYRAASEYRF